MKKIKLTKGQKSLEGKLNAYANLSKAIALTPIKNPRNLLPLSAAYLAGMPVADAQIVYSGTQNVSCPNITPAIKCYANINNAGGNDFSIARNVINPGSQFIQVDEVPGDFIINGFLGLSIGGYCYPNALASGHVIGAGGPWCFDGGQANTLSEIANVIPNEQWTTLPGGTTRFLGIRGTLSGQTKYGWIQLTKNAFANYNIVDWAYNNNNNQSLEAGQTSLPVELISFDHEIAQGKVALFWRTASESDNAGFDIERSENGVNFHPVGWVDGHGTSMEERSYEFMDKQLADGKTFYYRLRQVDFSGQHEYSKVITAKLGGGSAVGELFPNPTHAGKRVSLRFEAAEAGKWNALFYNASGKAMDIGTSLDFTVEKGENLVKFDVSRLPAGIFFLKMEDGVERVYRKLVID